MPEGCTLIEFVINARVIRMSVVDGLQIDVIARESKLDRQNRGL